MGRRVIADGSQADLDEPAPLWVWNRILCDVVMKLGGQEASSGQEVTVVYPEDGDPLNAAALKTNILDPLVDAVNDLNIDAIQRGGLRNEHIPESAILQFRAQKLTSGTTTANAYPGWATASLGGIGASPNWVALQDSLGNYLTVDVNDGSGAWDFDANPGFVLLFANIAFEDTSASGVTFANLLNTYGIFGIGHVDSLGGTDLHAAHQAFTNNPNVRPLYDPVPANDQFTASPCFADIPLFGFFDYRDTPPTNPIVQWRVLAALANHAQLRWADSTMFAIIFRP